MLNFKNNISFSTTLNPNISDIIINKDFALKVQHKPVFEIKNSDSWIDYSKTYVKIGTAKDAIYRLSPSDLQQIGLNLYG